jgi:hypothetical protein
MDPRTEKMLAERAQKMAATPPVLRGPSRAIDQGKRWARAHTNEAKLLAGVTAAVLFGAYYLFVTLPAQQSDRMQLEARAAETIKAETTANHGAVVDCLSKAQAEADARWTAACKAKREGPNCPLPEKQADAFNHDESAARNACLTQKF